MEAIRLEYAVADFDRDELVRLLCNLRDVQAELRAFCAEVTKDLLARADVKRWVIDGIGEVSVRKSIKRSEWDNDGITRKLVALALDERLLDEETGEFEPAWEAVARVLSDCSRPSWRVTPLRARGIQVDEYCHEEPNGYDVQLPPRPS